MPEADRDRAEWGSRKNGERSSFFHLTNTPTKDQSSLMGSSHQAVNKSSQRIEACLPQHLLRTLQRHRKYKQEKSIEAAEKTHLIIPMQLVIQENAHKLLIRFAA